MGWDVPNMYIEASFKGSDHWYLVAKPWNIFTGLQYSKAFLLGHGKYGKMPGWSPVKNLKGLPKNPSRDLSKLIDSYRDEIKDPTHLTLSELESIDLEKEIELPENGIDEVRLKDWGRYYGFYKNMKDSDVTRGINTESFSKEELKEVIEKGEKDYENFVLKADREKRKHYSSGFEEMLAFMQKFCEDGEYNTLERNKDQIRLVIWTH